MTIQVGDVFEMPSDGFGPTITATILEISRLGPVTYEQSFVDQAGKLISETCEVSGTYYFRGPPWRKRKAAP